MKSTDHKSIYFSAYPLKMTTQPSSANGTSPYLKAILSGKTRPMSRVKVLPMVNPYKTSRPYIPESKPEQPPEDKKLNENGWYNNYE